MLIALFADIHGNREALDACLADAERRGAERHVFLGDIVGYGADPVYCTDLVMRYAAEKSALCVLGNHDAAISGSDEDMNNAARAAIQWTRGQLSDNQKLFISTMPVTVTEEDRLYVHASAAQPLQWEYIDGHRAAERCLAATSQRVVFCGHIHTPTLYHMTRPGYAEPFKPMPGITVPLFPRQRWLAVLGSVGQPRDGSPASAYALVDTTKRTLTYLRVPYNIEMAAGKIRKAGLPERLATRLFHGG